MTAAERTRQTILLTRLDHYLRQVRDWYTAADQDDLLPPSTAPVREARNIAARMLDNDAADGLPLDRSKPPAAMRPERMDAQLADGRQQELLERLGEKRP